LQGNLKDYFSIGPGAAKTTTIWCNLKEPVTTRSCSVSSASGLQNEQGYLFPFEEDLAKEDRGILHRVFSRYFVQALGDDKQECAAAMKDLLGGWGNICQTRSGLELAHLMAGVELMYESGGVLSVMKTAQNVYTGFTLQGGAFTIIHNGLRISPAPFSELQKTFSVASPHSSALDEIFDMIKYSTDIDREREKQKVTCIRHIAAQLQQEGFSPNDKEKLIAAAKKLAFPSDVYLTINGANVARVLNIIATGIGEETIPLHAIALLEKNQAKRCLSAFGEAAPTFRLKNGRTLSLEGNTFQYEEVQKGGKKKITVTRMFVQVIPWREACRDWDLVLQDKQVHSLVGTAFANMASQKGMTREFKGSDAASMLASLKKSCGIVTAAGSSVGAGKRKAEEPVDEEAAKRRKNRADD